MRPRGCIISIHFGETTGGHSREEVVVVEKADLALVDKEGHLRAGQSDISEKAYYVRKQHTIIPSE